MLFLLDFRHSKHHLLYGSLISLAQKASSSPLVDRMTDTSKYTGTHKLRFDEEGKGRGLEGRDSVAKGKGMVAGSASALPAYVQGYEDVDTYDSKKSGSPKVKEFP